MKVRVSVTGGPFGGDWRKETTGLALVALGATAYGIIPILGKIAFGLGVQPGPLLCWRFALGAILLRATIRSRAPRPARWRLWALGPVFAGNAIAYFFALEIAPAASVSILLYVYPILVALLASLLAIEPLTLRTVAAAGLAFTGCALTAGGGFVSGRGIGLGLLAALLYALYVVLASNLARGVGAATTIVHVSESATVACLVTAGLRGVLLPPDPRAMALVLGIAALSTVVAMRAFMAGAMRIGPARASVASSLEVLVTLTLAATWLGEPVRASQWLGASFVLGAVVLQGAAARREP